MFLKLVDDFSIWIFGAKFDKWILKNRIWIYKSIELVIKLKICFQIFLNFFDDFFDDFFEFEFLAPILKIN